MINDPPPEAEGDTELGPQAVAYERRGVNTMLIIAIGVFALVSFYVSIIVASRVDAVVFPGRDLNPFSGISLPVVGSNVVVGSDNTPADRINILVMGLDQRLDESQDQPYRTDTVAIFTIDPATKTAGALSIPRDTRVEIPDRDGNVFMSTRINEAYEMGEYGVNGYPSSDGGGPKLAMETIERNFDIKINYYVILNWANFIQIIDELGGIDINVPEYVYDPAYSEYMHGDYYPVEFDPGPQHMDGHTALEYARLRHSDNDYKRIERQQIVMRAVATKATSLNLLDVTKAKDLYNAYKDSIRTNVPDLQIPGLADLASQVGLSNVKMVSAAPATYPCPYSICGGAAELLWYPDKFAQIKAQVFENKQVVLENAQITVLNGTNTPNLSSALSTQMTLQGISAAGVKTDEYANGLLWPSTLIIDASANTKPNTIAELRDLLGLTAADVITPTDVTNRYPDLEQFMGTTADLIVVLGADAQFSGSVGAVAPDAGNGDNGGTDYATATPEPTDEPVFTDVPVETDTPVETVVPTETDVPVETDTPAPTDDTTGG